jgi:hypothetical protein
MDKESTVIILVITLAIGLPFLLIYLAKKRKDIKFLKHFTGIAHKNMIIISDREFWDHTYAIAIDNTSKKILYANRLKDGASETVIDLAEVEKCRIVTVNKTLKNQNGKNPLTDRLELVFTFRDPRKPVQVLEFYNNPEFMPNAQEFAHIEKWNQIINSNLNQNINIKII